MIAKPVSIHFPQIVHRQVVYPFNELLTAYNLLVYQVHGNTAERDRILSMHEVLDGSRDIYLTTYDTFQVHNYAGLCCRFCP